LVNAAITHRCRLYLQQSVLYVYGDQQGATVDETTPLSEHLGGVLESALEMEAIVATAQREHGLPTITLRMGTFYGPDAAHTLSILDQLRRRKLPIIGSGDNLWNMLHLDDAASAVAAAVAHHEICPGEAFNIADGAPLPMGQMLREVAELLGAKPPRHVPLWLARWLIAPHLLQPLLLSLQVDAQKARARLGWQPRYANSKLGHQSVIQALRLPC
jgi:nucleoside-diphosphate-sugar epimerase